jgi:hypothetical protein
MLFVKKGIMAQGGDPFRADELMTELTLEVPEDPMFDNMLVEDTFMPPEQPLFDNMITELTWGLPLGYVSLGGEVVTLDGDLITFN